MYADVESGFIAFNEPLEARVHFMYLDVKSLVTTGIGNLIDADDPNHFNTNAYLLPDAYNLGWFEQHSHVAASRDEIDQEYRTVKFSGTAGKPIQEREQVTRLRITDAVIDQFVISKLHQMENALQGRPEFADLQNWPADAQLALFSMSWAMGPKFRFPNFQAAAAVGDWVTMVHESHMNTARNAGLIPRNIRNELLFTIADWVAAPEPGDFTILRFNPARSLADNMRAGTFPIPLNLDIGIQTALEQLGYNPNGLDGVFGPGTRGALTAFQRDHALPETPNAKNINEIGVDTLPAIEAELNSRQIDYWLR